MLVEHASQEQIDEINRVLDTPLTGEDGYDPDAEARLIDGLNLMFAGGPAPLDE